MSCPTSFVRTIGVVDLAGGVGILRPALTGILPRLTVLAALGCWLSLYSGGGIERILQEPSLDTTTCVRSENSAEQDEISIAGRPIALERPRRCGLKPFELQCFEIGVT